jgi:hypothetical protein
VSDIMPYITAWAGLPLGKTAENTDSVFAHKHIIETKKYFVCHIGFIFYFLKIHFFTLFYSFKKI